MEYLIRFLLIFFLLFIYNFIYLIVGFSFFYIGKFFHLSFLILFGHRLVAFGDAPFFGAHKNWLFRNCPSGCCSRCHFWTCSGKVKH